MAASLVSLARAIAAVSLLSSFATSLAAQSVHHVDADAAGADDGSNWANAYTDLQDALAAAVSGDEVWVAVGTYRPAPPAGDRNLSFDLINGVAIHGGFDGTELLLAQRAELFDQTILSGDLNGNDLPGFLNNGENSYSVTGGPDGTDSTAVIDGFTITAGNGDGGFATGGGMLNEGGSPVGPTVRNCTFLLNSAASGGGMANIKSGFPFGAGGSPTLTDCTFRENRATGGAGGGVRNDNGSTTTFIDCLFIDNDSGDNGGGLSSSGTSPVTLIDCRFEGNTATAQGGGARIVGGSTLHATRCAFVGNTAGAGGGGVAAWNVLADIGSNPTLIDCELVGNSASTGGGALFTNGVTTLIGCRLLGNQAENGGGIFGFDTAFDTISISLSNCVLSGNRAVEDPMDATSGRGGGAVFDVLATLTNCTLSENVGDTEVGGVRSAITGGDVTLTNCILWGNRDASGVEELAQLGGDGLIDVTFSCIDRFQALVHPGKLQDQQKVSGSAGSFVGPLDPAGRFGGSIAPLGDLDGDTVLDIAVGATLDNSSTGLGAVWILFLDTDGTVQGEQKINDVVGGFSGPLDLFGGSLAAPASSNGIADLAVGALADDTDHGAIWLLDLSSSGTVTSQSKISHSVGGFVPEPDGSQLGAVSLAWIGDIDSDGFEDLAVGSPSKYNDLGMGVEVGEENKVWILRLDSGGSVTEQQRISATQGNFMGSLSTGDRFGNSVALIGDLESDGLPELAVGAPLDDDGGTDRGAIWLLSLNTDGTVANERKISGTTGEFGGVLIDGDGFGNSLAPLGDLDGDTIPDVLVGASSSDTVWILFLRADGTVRDEQRIDSVEGCLTGDLASGDRFGKSAAAIGDLDADGVIDVAVGAVLDDAGTGALWNLFLSADQPTCPDSGGLRGITNIGDDPLFLGPLGPDLLAGTQDDNLRIASGSPCIDMGDDTALPADAEDLDGDLDIFEPLPIDLAGGPRDLDGDGDTSSVVDMGAHEFPVTVIDTDLDSFETIVLEPDGTSGDPTVDVAVTISNMSILDDETVSVSESQQDLHPESGGFSTPGTTVIVETSLADGDFFLTLSIPFSSADLAGADPLGVVLEYYDSLLADWVLAVAGNTVNSPGFPGPAGDFFPVTGTMPPLPSGDLGDHGVFWNPISMTGFAWANVDHTTEFSTNLFEDCNSNGQPDPLELDCDGDGIPDDCAIVQGLVADCNENGVPDSCDIASGTSMDRLARIFRGGGGITVLRANGIPDECELEVLLVPLVK